MREHPVTAGDVHDPSAPEQPPHAAAHLPRFVQLFPRQAPGMTHGPRDAIE